MNSLLSSDLSVLRRDRRYFEKYTKQAHFLLLGSGSFKIKHAPSFLWERIPNEQVRFGSQTPPSHLSSFSISCHLFKTTNDTCSRSKIVSPSGLETSTSSSDCDMVEGFVRSRSCVHRGSLLEKRTADM